MGPEHIAQALRAIAEGVEVAEEPSIASVAASLEDVLAMIESEDPEIRVALFGGIRDKLKNTKRKLFNDKRQRKLLKKMDRLKELGKAARKLEKSLRNHDNFADIMSDESMAAALLGAREFFSGGSEALERAMGAEDEDEAETMLADLDEHYEDADFEDDEDTDRDALADASRQFAEKCAKRIQELKGKLKKKAEKKEAPKEEPKKEEPEGEDVDLSQLETT